MLKIEKDQALWQAILEDDLSKARSLLGKGASPNKRRGTKSMLARALERDSPAMAVLLLEKGAKIDSAAHGTTCWDIAVSKGWTQAMKWFAMSGVDLDAPTGGNHRYTPAGLAASLGNASTLRWLARMGADVESGKPKDPRGEASLSIWMSASPSLEDESWWETFSWLARKTRTSEFRASVGASAVRLENRRKGAGRRAMEVLIGIKGWRTDQDFLGIAHNIMLDAGQRDWAQELRMKTRIPMNPSHGIPFNPWTESSLATASMKTKEEIGRPRRMAKAIALVDDLVEYGADPNVEQGGIPLIFFLAGRGAPVETIRRLLELGAKERFFDEALPNPSTYTSPPNQEDRERRMLNGSTLLHLASRERRADVIQLVARRSPKLIEARDSWGLTPLFRSLIPYLVWAGSIQKEPILPTLKAFRDVGASPLEETKWGIGLIHALVHAHKKLNCRPDDWDRAIVFVHEWSSQALELPSKEGRSGWEALDDPELAPEGSGTRALISQHKMTGRLPPSHVGPRPNTRL